MKRMIGDREAVQIPTTYNFTNGRKTMQLGTPKQDDESHNCDEMGCTSVEHVIKWWDATEEEKMIYEMVTNATKA